MGGRLHLCRSESGLLSGPVAACGSGSGLVVGWWLLVVVGVGW